jgi:uncharacterized integral membrane protein
MQKIRWFFSILAIALMLAAMLQNNQQVTVKLLWLERSTPLSVLLIATTIIGFLFGALMTASMLRSHRKRKEAAAKQAAKQPTTKKTAETSLETAATD